MRTTAGVLYCLCLAGPTLAAEKPAYRVLARDKGRVAIVAKGEIEWEVPCKTDAHDIAMLPSGNVLLLSVTRQ